MKFISWNIDSINAALTGTSPRSELSRKVLDTIAAEDADIIAIQETKHPEKGMNAKQEEALNNSLTSLPNFVKGILQLGQTIGILHFHISQRKTEL